MVNFLNRSFKDIKADLVPLESIKKFIIFGEHVLALYAAFICSTAKLTYGFKTL